MIYRPAAVTPLVEARTSTDPALANAWLPLAQRFRPTAGGAPLDVVVNHFKPKGGTGLPTTARFVDLRG